MERAAILKINSCHLPERPPATCYGLCWPGDKDQKIKFKTSLNVNNRNHKTKILYLLVEKMVELLVFLISDTRRT